MLRYVVHKGFVALDGTSLTVTRVDDAAGWWEVMLIAYTQDRVVLAAKPVGDTANVEVDVLAKYAEKSMAGYLAGLAGGGAREPRRAHRPPRASAGGRPRRSSSRRRISLA